MEAVHEFTLIIDGIPDLNPAIMNALFESGCDDATVSRQGGRISMDFVRAASTLRDGARQCDPGRPEGGHRRGRAGRRGTEYGSTEEIDGEVRRLIGA